VLPPIWYRFSYKSMEYPDSANNLATVDPAGPDPIICIFLILIDPFFHSGYE